MAHKKELTLPALVISPADVGRLKRELETLSGNLHQEMLRSHHRADHLPLLSGSLSDLAITNELDLLTAEDRELALHFITQVQAKAPIITMSFAADPSAAFLGKIIAWFRKNVDPSILLRTGLQPTIAAGCTLRTANQYYDFSLREHFHEQRPLLLAKLHGPAVTGSKP